MKDEDENENYQVAKGFDRGIDYNEIKNKLIDKYNELLVKIEDLNEKEKNYESQKRILINKVIYNLVALIQLKNGSRIIEACKATKFFFKNGKSKLDKKVTVKIAKSESIKYTKETKEQYTTKPRYREIKFPINWIEIKFFDNIKSYLENIKIINLKQRVLDYLLSYFSCNTHSLRYAYINFLLYEKDIKPELVAKMVGHVNTNQLTRYSQLKNLDKIFDIDD